MLIKAVPSIYADQYAVNVTAFVDRGFYYVQSEHLSREDEVPMTMHVAYTKCENHYYIGDLKTANFIVGDMGVTEQLQPSSNTGSTCAIGFNPETQHWFGWSHRATASFGIGTRVSKGDCAFEPSNREELEAELLAFWSNSEESEFTDRTTGAVVTCKTECVTTQDVVDSVEEDLLNPRVGIRIANTCTYSDGRKPLVSEHFKPYPAVWGRGEWTAETLEDAKHMARVFAESVG